MTAVPWSVTLLVRRRRSAISREVELHEPFVWMVLGAAAGWMTSHFDRNSSFGQAEIFLGMTAAVVGGIVAGLVFRLNVASGFNVGTVLAAFAAAVVVIAISRMAVVVIA